MYSGTGTVPESWRMKKGMFTSVPSEYRTRKPWPSAKCNHGLPQVILIYEAGYDASDDRAF